MLTEGLVVIITRSSQMLGQLRSITFSIHRSHSVNKNSANSQGPARDDNPN
jgi:hypothetical protein